jgi:hypothetical protein
MTEEEKQLWKIKVFRDVEDTDDIINHNLHNLSEERQSILNTIANTNNIISDYQSAVDRIGKRAKELMLPELKKRESSIKESKAPVLSTSVRATRRRPKI